MKNLNKSIFKKIKTKHLVIFSLSALTAVGVATGSAISVANQSSNAISKTDAIINHESSKLSGINSADRKIDQIEVAAANPAAPADDLSSDYTAIEDEESAGVSVAYRLNSIQKLLNIMSGLGLEVKTTSFAGIGQYRGQSVDYFTAPSVFAFNLGISGERSRELFTSINTVIDNNSENAEVARIFRGRLSFLYSRTSLEEDGISRVIIRPVYDLNGPESTLSNITPRILELHVEGIDLAKALGGAQRDRNEYVNAVEDELYRIEDLHLRGALTNSLPAASDEIVTDLDFLSISHIHFDNERFTYKITHSAFERSGSYIMKLRVFSKVDPTVFSDWTEFRVAVSVSADGGSANTGPSSMSPVKGAIIGASVTGAVVVVGAPFLIRGGYKFLANKVTRPPRVPARPASSLRPRVPGMHNTLGQIDEFELVDLRTGERTVTGASTLQGTGRRVGTASTDLTSPSSLARKPFLRLRKQFALVQRGLFEPEPVYEEIRPKLPTAGALQELQKIETTARWLLSSTAVQQENVLYAQYNQIRPDVLSEMQSRSIEFGQELGETTTDEVTSTSTRVASTTAEESVLGMSSSELGSGAADLPFQLIESGREAFFAPLETGSQTEINPFQDASESTIDLSHQFEGSVSGHASEGISSHYAEEPFAESAEQFGRILGRMSSGQTTTMAGEVAIAEAGGLTLTESSGVAAVNAAREAFTEVAVAAGEASAELLAEAVASRGLSEAGGELIVNLLEHAL